MKRVERPAAAAPSPPTAVAAGCESPRPMRIIHRPYARDDRRWVLQYYWGGEWKAYRSAHTRERVMQSAQYLASECGWRLEEDDSCPS